MYQRRGSAEGSAQKLKKAVDIWVEIFDATQSLLLTSEKLDIKILGFLYTAQYEYGCSNGNSETKAQSVQGYATVIHRKILLSASSACCYLMIIIGLERSRPL